MTWHLKYWWDSLCSDRQSWLPSWVHVQHCQECNHTLCNSLHFSHWNSNQNPVPDLHSLHILNSVDCLLLSDWSGKAGVARDVSWYLVLSLVPISRTLLQSTMSLLNSFYITLLPSTICSSSLYIAAPWVYFTLPSSTLPLHLVVQAKVINNLCM